LNFFTDLLDLGSTASVNERMGLYDTVLLYFMAG